MECKKLWHTPQRAAKDAPLAGSVYVTRTAKKLRRERLAASAMTVSIHTDRKAEVV
jgi:hypothetical protein